MLAPLSLIIPPARTRTLTLRIFSSLLFTRLLLWVNSFESANETQHFGKIPEWAASSNSASSGSNSSRRMLLADESSSATSSAGSAALPTVTTAAWAFCKYFDPNYDEDNKAWQHRVTYIGAEPYTTEGVEYYCYVYADAYAPVMIVLALFPQFVLMFYLQPSLVKNCEYLPSILFLPLFHVHKY